MRQCLDTNVLVRASLSKGGPARRLLDLIITQHDHTLVLSDYILDEVRDVLARPYIQRFSPQSGEDIYRYTQALANNAVLVKPGVEYPIVRSDPKDDPILFTAMRGQAEVLCTANLKHFRMPDAEAFCREHGIQVMTDVELLRKLLL